MDVIDLYRPRQLTRSFRSSMAVMAHNLAFPTTRRGRPRKFAEPSRAVTLTLPESVLAALERVDSDLSRAVVRVTQPEMRRRPHRPAELTRFGRRAVIVVNPTRTLERRTGVMLVPMSDGRALIAFDEPVTAARLELAIQDALDEHDLPAEDARIFAEIRDLLRKARTSKSVSVQQRNIIVIESLPRSAKRP
jgi:hypothetical protein